MTREEAIEIREALKMAKRALEQEPKYCDRNICLKNEYNNISCDECEVTKSQEPKTGYWLLDDSDDSMICDKCECTIYVLDMVDGEIHYCPNCGDKKEGITWID